MDLVIPRETIQTADSTDPASPQGIQPDLGMYLRPFVSRRGTQRHCDHLEKLQRVHCNPTERRIESSDVALFLEAAFSENNIHGYWEVEGRLSDEVTWTTIVCCETFELLVQCPPGKRITLVLNPGPCIPFLAAFDLLRHTWC